MRHDYPVEDASSGAKTLTGAARQRGCLTKRSFLVSGWARHGVTHPDDEEALVPRERVEAGREPHRRERAGVRVDDEDDPVVVRLCAPEAPLPDEHVLHEALRHEPPLPPPETHVARGRQHVAPQDKDIDEPVHRADVSVLGEPREHLLRLDPLPAARRHGDAVSGVRDASGVQATSGFRIPLR